MSSRDLVDLRMIMWVIAVRWIPHYLKHSCPDVWACVIRRTSHNLRVAVDFDMSMQQSATGCDWESTVHLASPISLAVPSDIGYINGEFATKLFEQRLQLRR